LAFALNGIPWGRDWRFYGVPIIQKHRGSSMTFGNGLQLRSTVSSNPLGPNRPVVLSTRQPRAVLAVGANFGMSGGTICAVESIVIGDDVVIGANSTIVDSDFHPLDRERRRLAPEDGRTAPVVIGNEVFVGMNCIILKGVVLGDGCVIGAGSVVSRDVPPAAIVAGNPATVVGMTSDR
jgi:acetyltransferase-like isoleucine patch superfamily enzyme